MRINVLNYFDFLSYLTSYIHVSGEYMVNYPSSHLTYFDMGSNCHCSIVTSPVVF